MCLFDAFGLSKTFYSRNYLFCSVVSILNLYMIQYVQHFSTYLTLVAVKATEGKGNGSSQLSTELYLRPKTFTKSWGRSKKLNELREQDSKDNTSRKPILYHAPNFSALMHWILYLLKNYFYFEHCSLCIFTLCL
jgi:hypothetical protein